MGSLPAREFPDSMPARRYIDTLDDFQGLEVHARVRAWGQNGEGQCDIPAGLGRIRDLALGTRSTAILLEDGSIRTFGQSPSPRGKWPEAYHLADGDSLLVNVRYEDPFGHHDETYPYDMIASLHGSLPPEITPGGDPFTGNEGNVSRLYPFNGASSPFSASESHLLYIEGGDGSYEALALPYHLSSWTPPRSPLPSQEAPYGQFSAQLSAGPSHGMILVEQTRKAYVYGSSSHPAIASPPQGAQPYAHGIVVPDLASVSAGNRHCLAVRDDGALLAWGSNSLGQCDVPPMAGRPLAVAAGSNHSAVLYQDGRLDFWGDLSLGQGHAHPSASGVVAVRTGPYHTAVYEHYGHAGIAFEEGQSEILVSLDPRIDDVPEPDESFRVVVADPRTGEPLATASGLIRDDDLAGSLLPAFEFRNFELGPDRVAFQWSLPDGTELPESWERDYQVQWSPDLAQWSAWPSAPAPGNRLDYGNHEDRTGWLTATASLEPGSPAVRYFRILSQNPAP